jgi:hypothetical protein
MHKLAVEEVKEVLPHRKKGGVSHTETRDTAHPKLVSDMLFSILEALGTRRVCNRIQKRVFDDVLWMNDKDCWRRSPLWLGIRIALRLVLVRDFGDRDGLIQYKNFLAFAMSQICVCTVGVGILVDDLTHVRAKLARRLAKLDNDVISSISSTCLESLATATAYIEKDWSYIQKKMVKSVKRVDTSRAEDATALVLKNSGKYLRDLMQEEIKSAPKLQPKFQCRTRLVRDELGIPLAPDFTNGKKFESTIALADFEAWVLDHSESWTDQKPCSDKTCQRLNECLVKYIRSAQGNYAGDPVQSSRMLLTVLVLWMAIDKHATRLYPLLKEYGPELPVHGYDCLLLLPLKEMEQLQRVEEYLDSRWIGRDHKTPSVFDDPSKRSFALRFFDSNNDMELLHRRIKKDGQDKEDQKHHEWKQKSSQYDSLMSLARSTEHTQELTRKYQGYRILQHSTTCRKCALEKEARSLTIKVSERPLPESPIFSKTAVFELTCPVGYGAWRDATWTIFNDLGRVKNLGQSKASAKLRSYEGLSPYAQGPGPRLTLASTTKSVKRLTTL